MLSNISELAPLPRDLEDGSISFERDAKNQLSSIFVFGTLSLSLFELLLHLNSKYKAVISEHLFQFY
jgi:hypothetical protein